MSRAAFMLRILQNYGSDKNCPFCNSTDTVLKQRKKLLLHLRSCKNCGLKYRWPKETSSFVERYYQSSYSEVAFTTDLPDPATLKEFVATNFAGSPKDFHEQIAVMQQFLPGGRVLDFGCSWGYTVFQLRSAGYDAIGFEISRPRAELGRRELGVEILDQLEDLANIPSQSIDGIFASHVLEHLISLKDIFTNFARILRPGGVLAIMVPNAGGKHARELGVRWETLINEKHTLALDRDFFETNLSKFGFDTRAFSDPYDPTQIAHAIHHSEPLPVEGEELMVIARRAVA